MDWGFVKDESNMLVTVEADSRWIEAFRAENGTSETVKLYLSKIFAQFGIPKTILSDDVPEFVVTLNSGVNHWELRKWNHPSIIQELMD